MDPVTVSTILTKLISAGVAINHAFRTEGFDETDISALKAVTEAGGSLFALAKKGTDARPAALYMALTSVCFGAALSAHWAGSKDMVPEQSIAPQWLTKWRNKAE